MDSTTPPRSGGERGAAERRAAVTDPLLVKGQNPHSRSPARGKSGSRRAAWRVAPASPGDHPLIHQFLVSVFHQPSSTEFQAQLEEPSYEPTHRLLIKDGSQIIAHLRVMNREMQFGDLTLPVGIVSDLATLPEYRGQGCASTLMAAARKLLLDDGAAIGLLATDVPRFYTRLGWFVCGRHCYTASPPRAILSHLTWREGESPGSLGSVLRHTARQRYNIRLWRHVELAALMRLYEENLRGCHGSLARADAYWRWLVTRGGSERIYVAINGPDKFDLDETLAPIVGYAAAREGRIVEINSSSGHEEAAVQLLGRVCGDAIEKDYHRVRVDASPGHSLHQLLMQAGGQHACHEADQGMAFMASVLKPRRFLKWIRSELAERARRAGLPRPCQLGLLINGEKYRLSVSRNAVELTSGTLGRSYLTCTLYEFNQLLMGHLNVRELVGTGKLGVSTQVALEMADALFPHLPLWRPPWDDLPAD